MKKYLITLLVITGSIQANAQVRIGAANGKNVNQSAVLELSNNLSELPSKWKTFLPPNVDFTNPVFTSSGVWGVSGSPVSGAIVYNIGNTNTNGFAGQGLYCWIGNRWLLINSADHSTGSQDKLRLALTASLTAYDTAAVNSWIMIQEGEYENLLQVLQGAAKYAANDSFMKLPSEIGWNQLYTVGGNMSATQIPANNYIVAWSIRTGVYNGSSSKNSRIKISSTQLSGYTDYGPSLPEYAVDANTRYYFLLKMPDSTTGPLPSYTAMYTFHAKFLGGRLATPGEYFTPGNSTTLNNNNQTQSAVQFICTPTRQW